MGQKFTKKLVMENGHSFLGYAFGAHKDTVCEVVFNTAMVGYQEAISDPSSTNHAIVMTYPLIGNYGINDEDYESKFPSAGALIVREYNDFPSNFRYTHTLSDYLEENGIVGISGLDTRKIARIIRDEGTQRVMLTDADTPDEKALDIIRSTPVPTDLVKRVSCKKRWYSRTANFRFNVVAVDCGIKLNIVRMLNRKGCNVTIVPYDTAAEEILRLCPDGVLISNGPGNPADVPEVISLISKLCGKLPIFGICLGYQLACLAYGASVYKMKFGHHGANHPVKCVDTGKIEITSQFHFYAVDEKSLEGTGLRAIYTNVLDNTVEGVESLDKSVLAVQFHPEGAPGPQDSEYLFDRFLKMMDKGVTLNAEKK
ncbi:MAG: glutamine-hydrolyzing carbamoyl-phosphate synthase small subunit [Oscillospiraceae bacterium]